jgi:glycine/D-amino acid oxidase-like deaminating enzyme
VVIVGGGVIGTTHAWEAVHRGHSVVQLEGAVDEIGHAHGWMTVAHCCGNTFHRL